MNCSHTTNCATCAPLLAAEKARADTAEKLAAHPEAKRDEVGLQLAAQSERLRLAMAVVDAAGDVITGSPRVRADVALEGLRRALAALDAVPGDALDTTGARWVGPDGEPER